MGLLFKQQIDFSKLTAEDIFDILQDTGYAVEEDEREAAEQEGQFKFVGTYSDGSARYLVGFKGDYNNQDEDTYFVTVIHVTIASGRISAEYNAMPKLENCTWEQMDEYIKGGIVA